MNQQSPTYATTTHESKRKDEEGDELSNQTFGSDYSDPRGRLPMRGFTFALVILALNFIVDRLITQRRYQ